MNAQAIAKLVAEKINANVADLDARRISCAEFHRRQFAAWDMVDNRPKARKLVRILLKI